MVERIVSFWESGTAARLAMIFGSLFVCCCSCVGLALIIPSNYTPIPTATVNLTLLDAEELAELYTPTLILPLPPTETPRPTDTPEPTLTPTATPQPILLNGIGDSVFDFNKWDGPAILHIEHTGASNFVLKNYARGESDPIDLLINTIGAYEGTIPIDIFEGEQTARFEVKADGAWEIQVLPMGMSRRESIPGTVTGIGDDVFYIDGGGADLLKADASQASQNFVVYALSDRRKLIVNQIAPYTGTSIIDSDSFMIIVNATGPWSIEITTR
jgi:hypothetical protein